MKTNVEIVGTKEANAALLTPRSVYRPDGKAVRVGAEKEVEDAIEETT